MTYCWVPNIRIKISFFFFQIYLINYLLRYNLPAKYRIAFWGHRGKCRTSLYEDRSISFYPPHKLTGRNRDESGNINSNNYNGVLDPSGTGDLIQFAACPGPNERQNMR